MPFSPFKKRMHLEIVQYGHPALRQKGERIGEITPEIEQLIADMLETMYQAQGVGLAAQQVGRALQLTVIDVREVPDRPSTMWIGDEEVELGEHMPLVLMNPEIEPLADPVEGPEGCLSFPDIYAEINRPEKVRVKALTQGGKEIEFVADGLLARAVQHETDHLHGILFIDRMSTATKAALKPELNDLQEATKKQLARKR